MTITDNDYVEEENRLSEEDIEVLVPIIAKGLRHHVGHDNRIKAKDIISGLAKNVKIEISEVKLKRIIRYIRHHDIVSCVMSLGGGYWVATSKEECIKTIQMFYDRSNAEKYSMLRLIQQSQERYNIDIDINEDGQVYINE